MKLFEFVIQNSVHILKDSAGFCRTLDPGLRTAAHPLQQDLDVEHEVLLAECQQLLARRSLPSTTIIIKLLKRQLIMICSTNSSSRLSTAYITS